MTSPVSDKADATGATPRPWEEAAEHICAAVEARFTKSVDRLYDDLLQTTQDYLRENVDFNLKSTIDSYKREAARLRAEAAEHEAEKAALQSRVTVLERVLYEEMEDMPCSDALNEMIVEEVCARTALSRTSAKVGGADHG